MNDKTIEELELRLSNARRIQSKINAIEQGVLTLEHFKQYSGNTVVVGYSGKIGDNTPIDTVKLNDFACAVSVLDLMIKTGNDLLTGLYEEYESI